MTSTLVHMAKRKKLAALDVAQKIPGSRQYGVIPIRFADESGLEVLLLTSRGTGRWVIPKGWPMAKRKPSGTARREAYEEAGIEGRLLSPKPVGSYRYVKGDEAALGEILVEVFLLVVERQQPEWPEREERRTRWFSVRRAASLVRERELSRLLRAVPQLVEGRA